MSTELYQVRICNDSKVEAVGLACEQCMVKLMKGCTTDLSLRWDIQQQYLITMILLCREFHYFYISSDYGPHGRHSHHQWWVQHLFPNDDCGTVPGHLLQPGITPPLSSWLPAVHVWWRPHYWLDWGRQNTHQPRYWSCSYHLLHLHILQLFILYYFILHPKA